MGLGFSPAFSGGLIEAKAVVSIFRYVHYRFPPRSAGASLKRDVGAYMLLRHWLFSPAFSGGLIEATGLRPLTTGAAAFSPAFSGGLIEAMAAASTVSSGSSRFSPAFSGGLIEA